MNTFSTMLATLLAFGFNYEITGGQAELIDLRQFVPEYSICASAEDNNNENDNNSSEEDEEPDCD